MEFLGMLKYDKQKYKTKNIKKASLQLQVPLTLLQVTAQSFVVWIMSQTVGRVSPV